MLLEWPPEEVGSVAAETGLAAPCTLAGMGEQPLATVGPQGTRARACWVPSVAF